MGGGFQLLHQLPTELLQDILDRLHKADLFQLSTTSKLFYKAALPYIWRHVELVDCCTDYEEDRDDHDDTPLIRKLLLLATRPWIASWVEEVTHRCHLPPPAIFRELPFMPFNSQTLSTDPRTIKLVQLAAKNLKNVHTLRIIAGHPTLTDALLRCFFDAARCSRSPEFVRVRKLWLENCRVSIGLNMQIEEHPYGLPLGCNFQGLEAVRLRRLPLRPGTKFQDIAPRYHYAYARGGIAIEMNDGLGGTFSTSMNDIDTEIRVGEDHCLWLEDKRNRPSAYDPSPLETFYQIPHNFDDRIYEIFANEVLPDEVISLYPMTRHDRAAQAYRGSWLDPSCEMHDVSPFVFQHQLRKLPLTQSRTWKKMQHEKIPSAQAAISMLSSASATLTSLNLDWVLSVPSILGRSTDVEAFWSWTSMFVSLFSCRFPHLRAFQFRNCVVPEAQLPRGLYMLDHSAPYHGDPGDSSTSRLYDNDMAAAIDLAALEFMEAHRNLKCLAWPMDRFFSPNGPSEDIAERVEKVIENLGRTLESMRIDTLYAGASNDEAPSEEIPCSDPGARSSRRRFIAQFAPKMRKIESIKIEGGMPRDERREVVRALHACPLQKIVMIGTSFPLGNTWGENGQYIGQIIENDELSNLPGEDDTAVYRYGLQNPKSPGPDFQYDADYGWAAKPQMIHTLASYHRDTVKELKFCGYKGSPVLYTPTAITAPLLGPLKHFHRLESVIMSLWLTTLFENGTEARDAEIIKYWTSIRSPASTAFVAITDEEPEAGSWEHELKTKYAPDALAWRVTNLLGPYLSEQAKQREGGVHVRASFCVGDMGGIFDLDLRIGKGAVGSDVCKEFAGPREEVEDERRKGKLRSRGWF